MTYTIKALCAFNAIASGIFLEILGVVVKLYPPVPRPISVDRISINVDFSSLTLGIIGTALLALGAIALPEEPK